jgi:hypothetical protein
MGAGDRRVESQTCVLKARMHGILRSLSYLKIRAGRSRWVLRLSRMLQVRGSSAAAAFGTFAKRELGDA